MSRGLTNRSQTVAIGLAMAALTSLLLYQLYQQFQLESGRDEDKDKLSKLADAKSRDLPGVSTPPPPPEKRFSQTPTPVISNARSEYERNLHTKIEELDKKGKVLFKSKKFLEAAQVFTEALQLIEDDSGEKSNSLARQVITLTNNRSAMYEKAGLPDLALEDCRSILDQDVGHEKARTRRLRILESQNNYAEALVEVCALQLKFMHDNRDKLRLGIHVTPPVPQSKLEEFLQHLLPAEVERYVALQSKSKNRPLPSAHTLAQLLKSFSGYNSWMASAARDGSVTKLTEELNAETDAAKKATLYLKRGRRQAYDNRYKDSIVDFEAGLALVEDKPDVQATMETEDYARLLEWTGMARHWQYDLDGALKCYEKCFELDSTNVSWHSASTTNGGLSLLTFSSVRARLKS